LASGDEKQPEHKPPYIDESLVINTRLNEIQREQREEKEEQRKFQRDQLRFNKVLAWFTGLLFLTSAVSDLLLLRQTSIGKESADAARKSADTAAAVFKLTYRPRLKFVGITPAVQSYVNGELRTQSDNGRLRVTIDLPNLGPYSARNVRFFKYDNVSARDRITKLAYEELLGEPKLIPPKAEGGFSSSMTIVGKKVITPTELTGLQNGTLWATFSILITYDDDFEQQIHHAEYCDLFTLQPYNDICPWPVQND
jgi:hypothetical protein